MKQLWSPQELETIWFFTFDVEWKYIARLNHKPLNRLLVRRTQKKGGQHALV